MFYVRNGERLLNILFDTHENKKKGEERKKYNYSLKYNY